MRNVFCFIIALFLLSATTGQTKKMVTSEGEWTITAYSSYITKITFKVKHPTHNENISDAVLLKPVSMQTSIPFQFNKDGIINTAIKGFQLSGYFSENGFQGFKFHLNNQVKVYGGGERALPLDRRGHQFNLYNNPWYGYGEGADNLNYSVPFFTTSDGYGLFFDNPSRGYADICKNNPEIFKVGFTSGELNVYVITGKNYEEILTSYHQLTGKQPLPPRWALGNFMSRFGYSSQKQVNLIAEKMNLAHIPVDAIIFDLFWFGDSIKGTMGNLAWVNKEKWPDPAGMIAHFKEQHVQSILITEPFILKSSLNYENSKRFHATDSSGKPFILTDFYFGLGGLIDIFRTDAQNWFWSKHQEQMKWGVAAWWGDLGEPEKHPAAMNHQLHDIGFNRSFGADEVHNIYGHYWTKMLFNQFAKNYPDKRLFSLNRSGFAGTQRYGIFPWSGDVSRSWSGLKAQLPIMLGMSMSGVPYIHADAGGYAGGTGDKELYIRWLQFAAFTPIFRPHSTTLEDIDKNAFSFPSEAALFEKPYLDYARDAILLRYSMLPYNYTMSYQQAVKGKPLVAPLYYYFPQDTAAVGIQDEYMWGENMLVVPIIDKGADNGTVDRKYYLPQGKWYQLFQNATAMKEGWQHQEIDINQIAVFVKAGSFVPMIKSDGMSTTSDYHGDTLLIHYFWNEASSAYDFFDDDGISKKSISSNAYELIHFAAANHKGQLSIRLQSNGGKYPGKPLSRHLKFIVHGFNAPVSTVTVNGKNTSFLVRKNTQEAGATNLNLFECDFTGSIMNIDIK